MKEGRARGGDAGGKRAQTSFAAPPLPSVLRTAGTNPRATSALSSPRIHHNLSTSPVQNLSTFVEHTCTGAMVVKPSRTTRLVQYRNYTNLIPEDDTSYRQTLETEFPVPQRHGAFYQFSRNMRGVQVRAIGRARERKRARARARARARCVSTADLRAHAAYTTSHRRKARSPTLLPKKPTPSSNRNQITNKITTIQSRQSSIYHNNHVLITIVVVS